MSKKTKLIILLATALLASPSPADARRGFAIVVDPRSLSEAKAEINAYSQAIEQVNGLKVITIADRWGVPDSIRACLKGLYEKGKIEGVALIGDIPIPMVRDGQHLTSAFKMKQSSPRRDSSVPSDRYYDDFGLKFKYLGRDSVEQLFYYSLTAQGQQRIHCDIYSGRIRPTDVGGTSRYERLRRYLRKATAEKLSRNRLDHVFFFTGQGSLNESRKAYMDEKISMYDHFPWLRTLPYETVRYMDHSQEKYIKPSLMNELQRQDLDIALLHHHGDYDTQYLGKAWKDMPDSVDKRMRDLHLEDFAAYGFRPNARFVIFDACYNAAFLENDFIANEYIFSEGKTVACMGGTVNLLQDKWYDRMLGLMGYGFTAGQINNFQEYLESHIIGDPTFTFAPERSIKLSATEDGQTYQLTRDYERGRVSSSKLLSLVESSPYDQVRLQALEFLSRRGGEEFIKGIATAAADRYEMTQRFAVNFMKANGSRELALPLMRLYSDANTASRVKSDAALALQYFPTEWLQEATKKALAERILVDRDSTMRLIESKLKKNADYWTNDINEMLSDTVSEKTFRFVSSCMRIYCPHYRIPDILAYVSNKNNTEAHRLPLIEAMGWYGCSYQAPKISQCMKAISEDTTESEAIRQEALKTYKRTLWEK